MDSSLSWKNRIDVFVVKLDKACYAIRSLRYFVSYKSLRMIYCSYFHSIMSYGIISWGNSSQSKNIQLNYKKKMVRIITNSKNRDSWRDLFRKLNILIIKTNSELYEINTRNKINFHLSQPRFSIYRNGLYYMGTKAFNRITLYFSILLHCIVQ
jgi:hypothetical protein